MKKFLASFYLKMGFDDSPVCVVRDVNTSLNEIINNNSKNLFNQEVVVTNNSGDIVFTGFLSKDFLAAKNQENMARLIIEKGVNYAT